jgi:hypothetical protein
VWPRAGAKRRTGIEPASSPWKGEALPLSYHRAGESGSKSGPPTMTVCTNDVALGDLVEDSLPFAVAEAFGDVEPLASRWSNSRSQGSVSPQSTQGCSRKISTRSAACSATVVCLRSRAFVT